MRICSVLFILVAIVQPTYAELSDDVRAELTDLIIVTDQYPPLNYLENDELKGFSAELLRLVYQQLEIELPDIDVVPWTRGYHMLQSEKRVMLFSTARTSSREPLFKWVGPIYRSEVQLVTWQGSGIDSYDPATMQSEKILAVRSDITRVVLDERGYPAQMITEADNTEVQYRLFMKKRVKLASVSRMPFNTALAELPDVNVQPITLQVMRETSGHFAFSLTVSDPAIAALQRALDEIRPQHLTLIEKYQLDL